MLQVQRVLLVHRVDRLVLQVRLDQQVTRGQLVLLVFEVQQVQLVTLAQIQLFLVLLALEDRQVHRVKLVQ